MSDTTVQECNCCREEWDCINGLCEMCSDYNYKLQKQADLLTLGLLQEKNKVTNLLKACKFTKAQIKKGSQKKALPILRQAIAESKTK